MVKFSMVKRKLSNSSGQLMERDLSLKFLRLEHMYNDMDFANLESEP